MQLRYTNKAVWEMACKVAAAPNQRYIEHKERPDGVLECWLTIPNANASFAFPDRHELIGEWGGGGGLLGGWARFRPKNGWYMGSNPEGLVKCFYLYTANSGTDIQKTYLCESEHLHRHPMANEVLEDVASYPPDWVWSPVIPDPEPDTQVIDVDVASWREIKLAASESTWIPPEYYMNDWVSDVCRFLREGHMLVEVRDVIPLLDALIQSEQAVSKLAGDSSGFAPARNAREAFAAQYDNLVKTGPDGWFQAFKPDEVPIR